MGKYLGMGKCLGMGECLASRCRRPLHVAVAAATLGLVLGAAGPAPNAAPSSPDNETTALQQFTDTHLGVTRNSLGTTTNTGTPAQSAATEYQAGSQNKPPNVGSALAPAPILALVPPDAAVPRRPNQTVPGHSLTGNFAGKAGAVNGTRSMPLDPYRAILAPGGSK